MRRGGVRGGGEGRREGMRGEKDRGCERRRGGARSQKGE